MEKKTTVSDAELEILETLWSADRALNAGEIRSCLDPGKGWERTTACKKESDSSGEAGGILLFSLYAQRRLCESADKEFRGQIFCGKLPESGGGPGQQRGADKRGYRGAQELF